MKTCKLYLPVVRMLEITKIIDFNQANYTWYCVCCLFFGSQFRLVNYFDSEIVQSLSAYFGKTRSEIGYTLKLKLRGSPIESRSDASKRCR